MSVDPQTREDRYGECAVCEQPYERSFSPGGCFLSHFDHPEDGHDAVARVVALEATEANDIVTTADELNALPLDSIVVDDRNCARMKRAGNSHMPGGWTHAGNSPLTSTELADGRPMRVIWRGRPVVSSTQVTPEGDSQ